MEALLLDASQDGRLVGSLGAVVLSRLDIAVSSRKRPIPVVFNASLRVANRQRDVVSLPDLHSLNLLKGQLVPWIEASKERAAARLAMTARSSAGSTGFAKCV